MAPIQNKKVKELNQERIHQLLRKKKELTKQEISVELGMSMPTTLQNVNEMLERGVLEECGENESTGGRKAKRIQLVKEVGFAVGIEIGLHHVRITITDFIGNYLASSSFPLVFQDKPAWYRELGSALAQVLEENKIQEEKVVGVGISFPGIIDAESDYLVRSHIFQIEHMSLDRFRINIPYPMEVFNDANCAGFAEVVPGNESYSYLSLNETVGGALLKDAELFLGDHHQAGEVGHIILRPQGKRCYCGKEGCADSYLSRKNLTERGKSLDEFLLEAQMEGTKAHVLWQEYLDNLAILATNMHMLADQKIIIGGEVGACMEPYMQALCERAEKYDLFARDIDYLEACKVKKHICSIGAARLILKKYGSRILV